MNTIITLLFILTAILIIWALGEIILSKSLNLKYKAILILGVIFFPLIGSILYFQFKNKFKGEREFKPFKTRKF